MASPLRRDLSLAEFTSSLKLKSQADIEIPIGREVDTLVGWNEWTHAFDFMRGNHGFFLRCLLTGKNAPF